MAATTAKDWKSSAASPAGKDLELPSGNVCLARPIPPEAFLKTGFIPDPLSKIITEAVNSKKGLPPSKVEEISGDPEKLSAAMETFDRVLVYSVVQPVVNMPPKCAREGCSFRLMDGGGIHMDVNVEGYHRFEEPERDEDVLYADMVDLEDKIFVFNWCVGGTADVESFRTELQGYVGDVSDGEDVPDEAE